ncbi:GxxExxY protein [Geotalea toluenoxydans]
MKFEYISAQVIAAAIEVHRNLGPGLLESAYEECLCHEMRLRQIQYERQKHLPVTYKGKHLECGYRIDIVAGGEILLELKCVEKLLPIHEAQILTYLKLSGLKTGLLINFNAVLLKDGIKRMVL